MTRSALGSALVAWMALLSAPASADTPADRQRAQEAYDRASSEYQRGEYAAAARDYVIADDLAHSPASLMAALDAAVRADDPVLGETLLVRMARRAGLAGLPLSLRELAEYAREKFAHRTGRVRVTCSPGCVTGVDGVPVSATEDLFVLPGPHRVSAQVGDRQERRIVDVRADETTYVDARPSALDDAAPQVEAKAEPKEWRADEEPSRTLSPAWFYVALGTAAVLGVATAISGDDTLNRHNQFQAANCASVGSQACTTLGSEGSSAQVRTNVLLGVTAVAAVTTVTLGVFFVRWGPRARASVAVGPGPSAWFGVAF